MYREKMAELREWSEQASRKPLIIRGARQVGKSTLVRMFAEQNGLDLLELNFERNPDYADFFVGNAFGLNPKKIIELLEVSFNQDIAANPRSLLFLDEIQVKPEVLKVLRYFYEEMPDMRIVVAGSLLDFELNRPVFSLPVGRVSYMHLHPMGFIEFLYAIKQDKLAQYLNDFTLSVNSDKTVISVPAIAQPIHAQLLALFKTFTLVGGMPEVVKNYAQYQSLRKCEAIKHDLMATFQNDFAKYAKHHQFDLISKVFSLVSINLGQKIKYSNISKEYKAADVAKVVDLLESARVIKKVIRSAGNGLPISAEANHKFFKLIFLDVGLVSSQLNLAITQEDLMLINKGDLAEQWVGQALLLNQNAKQMPALHYWAREKKSSSAEVDYLIAGNHGVVPVEVKAGKTGTLKSLHLFITEKSTPIAIRFNTDTPSFEPKAKIVSLPIYLAEKTHDLMAYFK